MNKILITSIGRTGTKSLSSFLDLIPDVCSFHEKEKQDISFLFLSQLSQYSNLTKSYLTKRDKEILPQKEQHYIEVNPYFRFADAKVLKSLGWKKIFITRHPKTYLESVYTRSLFTDEDNGVSQFPDNNDPISEKWYSLSRFQKLCWYYAKAHQYIVASNLPIYRMEDLFSNSENLKSFISDLGIDVSSLKSFQLPKVNTSAEYQLKNKIKSLVKGEKFNIQRLNWNALTEEELETYNNYCKPLLKPLGYVL